MAELKAGDPAPNFDTVDHTGKAVSLKGLKGKNIILYFYPKDNTPGCTKESCGMRDQYDVAAAKNTVILGVSADSAASHQKFVDKYSLPFSLLMDEDKSIIEAYGAWGEKNMYGKKSMGIIRTTCVIGPDGKIRWIGKGKGAEDHVLEMLEHVDA